jgi:cell division septal protein FtsQ
MRFGGSGWKPASRRNRRQGRAPRRSTEEGADRAFILILVVFGLVALGLVLVIGFLST